MRHQCTNYIIENHTIHFMMRNRPNIVRKHAWYQSATDVRMHIYVSPKKRTSRGGRRSAISTGPPLALYHIYMGIAPQNKIGI
jgi:hypothetical protein